MTIPPAYCITCEQTPERRPVAEKHFADAGLSVAFVQGIHGRTWGLSGDTGLILSHWMLWQHCLLAGHREAIALEDDCILVDDFRQQFAAVRATLPDDWQMVFLGSLGTEDRRREPVNDLLVEVADPIGTHCYLVRDSALPILLKTNQQASLPIDLQLHTTSLPKLACYVAWPSLAAQRTHKGEWPGSCRGANVDMAGSTTIDRLLSEPRMSGSDGEPYGGGRGNPYNRIGGLIDLIRHARPQDVAEIGCNVGVSTEAFLLYAKKVVCVDPWQDPQTFRAFLRRTVYPGRWVERRTSLEAAPLYAAGSFDLVYIDACHDYGNVAADITAWIPKTRRWMAGHDYCSAFPGVMQAVRERFGAPMVFADSSWLVEVHPAPQEQAQQHGAADRQE